MAKPLTITILVVALVIIAGIVIVLLFQNDLLTTNPVNTNNTINRTIYANNTDTDSQSESILISNQDNKVYMQSYAFSPSTITINRGESVTWTNEDEDTHTVTSDSGDELDSDLIGTGETYTHVFSSPGIYEYHCTPHPDMRARVIVQ